MQMIRIARHYLSIGILLFTPTLAFALPEHSGQPIHPRASEYALEAAYIFNFIQFTEWPNKKRNMPVTVLVIGDDMVRGAMQRIATASDKSGRNRLRIDPCTDLTCLGRPQVLFIGSDQQAHLQQWLDSSKQRPILTVSDIPGFADKGGMIELIRRGDRLSFRINRKAIANSGLYVSAQLLQLGEIVDGESP